MRSPWRRTFWNLWFAWQAQHNVIHAFHPAQAEIPFSWGKVFGRYIFTINDPELIHEVLVKHHARYHKGALFQRLFRPGLGESVLTAEGQSWVGRRKMIAPAFHARALAALETRMQSQIDAAMADLGSQLDSAPWSTNLALSIALEGLFSGDAGDPSGSLAHHLRWGIDGYGRMSIPDVLNMPAWVPRPAKRRAKAHADQVDAIIFDLIDQRQAKLAQGHNSDPPDLLDLILASREGERGRGLARQDIRNEVFTFFAAGHDTTANALQWALLLLADRPALQAELAAEVSAAPDWRGWTRLGNVIQEVLRLYPPVFALMREALVDHELAGVRVPVGALLVIPVFYFHRSPTYWQRPTTFDPDHFSAEASTARPRHAYIPFGLGPRVCPGKAMALQTLHLILANLLKSYELHRLDTEPIEPFAKLTLRPSQSFTLGLRARP